MPNSLWMLLSLNFRATFRRVILGARTLRGILFLALGMLVVCLWLLPSLYYAGRAPQTDPRTMQAVFPFALLAFCLGNLVTSFAETAVAFTPAEVDFLFSGPFSRRNLLFYKIARSALGTLLTTIILAIIFMRFSVSFPAACVGVWLTVQFMQLFAMVMVMLGQSVGQRLYGAGRQAIALVVVLLGVIALVSSRGGALADGPARLMQEMQSTLAGKVLLAPFSVFARTIAAASLAALVKWGALALLIDLVMLVLVMALDANYLEASAAASQRRYRRLYRGRRGTVVAMGATAAKLRLPSLPFWCGIGPVAWRQLLGAMRSARGTFVMMAIIIVGFAALIVKHQPGHGGAVDVRIGAAIWINLFFVSLLRFDFRDDLDRLDLLRSLPIHPWAVVVGELVAPVLVLLAVQTVLGVAALLGPGVHWRYLVAAGAFAVPFNVFLVGVENLFFLWFPLRSAGLIAGDMQLFGRQMVLGLVKFLIFLVGLGLSAAMGLIAYLLTGRSALALAVVMLASLVLAAISPLPLLARTYASFDPSIDTPA